MYPDDGLQRELGHWEVGAYSQGVKYFALYLSDGDGHEMRCTNFGTCTFDIFPLKVPQAMSNNFKYGCQKVANPLGVTVTVLRKNTTRLRL